MDIRNLITPAAVAAYWAEVGSNLIDYVGPVLFPARKKAGLDLAFIKGSKGLPVTLMPSAFDAKATFRDRIGFDKLETEMPFFREGFKVKERDRQEILRIEDANDPYLRDVLNRIFDDAADLIAGAAVVPERMIWQLLVDGKIEIKANGTDYSYNYDTDGSWATSNKITLTSGDMWSAASTADPFKNFKAAKDSVRSKTGTQLTTAIMSTATFNLMANTDAVKNRYLSTSGLTLGYLTDAEVSNVVAGTSGLNIVVYDKQYRDETKTAKSFLPDGYVVMVPNGALGSTWYGTTPEEADLRGANTNAEVSIVNTGVAITRVIDPHPVNLNTFASEIVLPSFERMEEIAVLKVTA